MLITRRALNRATLARQMLLARSPAPVARTIEHLVGMQAQNPHDPYYGLWARLEGFDPAELSSLIIDREVVRMPLLRSTIHLVTATDARAMRPALDSVLARTFGSTSFSKNTGGVDRKRLLAAGRSLLSEEPRSRAQLGPLLADRWPGIDPGSLAQAITYLVPVVQVPPRGIWKRTGPAAWTTLAAWLGSEAEEGSPVATLVLRYIAAFGPAATKDIRVWSGLAGLSKVVDQLRPQLVTFRDESGSELFDLPDAPRPNPDTPAPPRFLPEYDNLLLSHSDRSRFFDRGPIPPGWVGNLLIDGLYVGHWKINRRAKSVELEVTLGKKLPKAATDEMRVEADRLLALTDSEAAARVVRIAHAG